jgi:hypothetical protein
MTLILTAVDHEDLCHGWSWEIQDEGQLVEDVARVALGQYRHVEKILAGISSRAPTTRAEHIADALAKLEPDANGANYRRDGWIFQVISWIAAHHNKGGAIIRAPHIRKADHGFDGLQLDLSDDKTAITAVTIGEDKATDDPRNTITQKVWPDIVKLEANERITELTHDVTSMLATQLGAGSPVDIDRAVEEILWKDARRYRVSITVKDEHQAEDARAALFAGFDDKAAGPVARRRAETICIPDVRSWMNQFAERVKLRLQELLENV